MAGFIGSPAMNFLGGTLEDGMLRTSLGDFQLSDRLRRAVESAGSGREVIVGLRPENFEDAAMVSADARPNGITFHTTIDVLESMGSDVFVYFTQEREQGVNAAELEELAKDSGRADTGGSGDTVVARLDAATTHPRGRATPSSGWMAGRCTCSTRPAAATCRWRAETAAARSRAARPQAAASAHVRTAGSAAQRRCRQRRRGPQRGGQPQAGSDAGAGSAAAGGLRRGGHLIVRRRRSMISSFQSWVMMSR